MPRPRNGVRRARSPSPVRTKPAGHLWRRVNWNVHVLSVEQGRFPADSLGGVRQFADVELDDGLSDAPLPAWLQCAVPMSDAVRVRGGRPHHLWSAKSGVDRMESGPLLYVTDALHRKPALPSVHDRSMGDDVGCSTRTCWISAWPSPPAVHDAFRPHSRDPDSAMPISTFSLSWAYAADGLVEVSEH